ncbi:MAG TPA: NAD(P)/FAD-dependent oxidoreductase [Candidatus Dormibacteraeota bacterium]|nr:NAD(P)/FAD-dependent oxidoreductase [Candidatus Dormibacteraeota bacterium]
MADTEVVIVGAGPAGSALATMLGMRGVGTVLLDSATFPRDKACGEGLMPSGAQVLRGIGIDVEALPAIRGVTYRVPQAGSVGGEFTDGKVARGARRLVLDAQLAERARSTPNVDARFGCEVSGLERRDGHRIVRYAGGEIGGKFVVGADGLHSRVARWTGWARPPRRPHRYAFTGHVTAPAHRVQSVLVTILDGCEVYTAPTAADELLVAVLGTKAGLRREGEPAAEAYTRHVAEAHPELSVEGVDVRGAGPFWVRPARVAGDRVFLLGDAAGFLDPLTGDGMSDALAGAARLADLLASGVEAPERAYARWEAAQWRRRALVARLARLLTGSSAVARRALLRLQKRPVTLNRLLEVNDGTRSLWSLSPRDWATLAGV